METIRWFETEACYVFHPMNAWEEGDKIFADVMEYPDAPLFPNADGSRGDNAAARLVRWTFDLADKTNRIKREPLDDLAGEFPRFDERRAGLAYRHGWFAGNRDRRADMASTPSPTSTWPPASGRPTSLTPATLTGEPIFVPRSADAPEGDGWVIAVVYRGAEDRSDFVVFDAQDIAAGPIATAKLPRRVPFGFHGNWRPA